MNLSIDFLDDLERSSKVTPERIRKVQTANRTKSALELDGPDHFERRKEMLTTVSTEPVLDAQERYMGTNDLLPINYLLLGYLQSRAVGRITYFDKVERKVARATGFLITPDLLITNHHVFPVNDVSGFMAFAEDAVIEFGVEYDLQGHPTQPLVFKLDPEKCLITDKDLDMAVIGVATQDATGRRNLRDQGYLVLNGTLGKVGQGDFATVIQHAEGKDKKVALRNNEILDSADARPFELFYVSDTAHGSSGGYVANNEWQVIALHSAGVGKKNAEGKYVDKNDQVIEPVNGKIDGDRVVWIHNRGIRVSSIMEFLRAQRAHPLIQALFTTTYAEGKPYLSLTPYTAPLTARAAGDHERVVATSVAAPEVAAAAPQPINIHISIGTGATPAVMVGSVVPATNDIVAFEKKYEDELEFTDCAGFDEEFLGIHVPMPVPTAALRKKLAFHLEATNQYLLHYHHYSTIHHAVRRVPVVGGINVSRNQRYAELDKKGSRKDKWFRDNRIDYGVQLTDAYYALSGFDKGHICRREDAEWGSTVNRAKLAADLTCSYTNAVPQVPALNRSKYGGSGLWGQLEDLLLEKGVELERGKSGRICVFGGPIFKDDDPVFKGVQVAMDFFKVVVWYDADGNLRSTCFILTQEDLVDGIEFEALRFDRIFRAHQRSIKEIEKATGLRFHSHITEADTFTAGDDANELTYESFSERLGKYK